MDNPTISEPREAVPDWAQAGENDAPDPNAWSPAQQKFVQDLFAERDVSHLAEDQLAWLQSVVNGEKQLTKQQASELISKMLKFSKKKTAETNVDQRYAERFAVGVPAGRYAVENDDGELRFINVWVSRDKKRINVYVLHGPDESDLRFQKTVLGVLMKIKAAGIRQAAIRYGLEIGSCSNCGRRLTNRISRELGIGPVCGGRMFGNDAWKEEVWAKRGEIVARGEDPDEELA